MWLGHRGPRVLGTDDWAWRKGHRYGTILCDLERGKVIDLLPERSEESTEAWMRRHPGTEIVSRDRASLYAEAATKAAPRAIQVADRWHLLHNLSETLVDVLAPHHRLLTEVAKATSDKPDASEPSSTQPANPAPPRSHRQRWQQRCHNGTRLWRELRERGFRGQAASVRNWIRKRYGPRRCRAKRPAQSPSPATRASPRYVAWLVLKEPQEARNFTEELCRRSPQINQCARLAREFCRMIRERD